MLKEKWSHLWAACCMFTRLPLWRIWCAPAEAYAYTVHHWMVAGGLLAAFMACLTFFGVYPWVPVSLTVLFLILGNLFVTGAFHEDGLADFFDGFGGGTSRERILEIMKDSHIGTYGVLALMGYFLLLFVSIGEWTSDFEGLYHAPLACVLVYVVTAVWSRFLASFVPATLDYARTAETAKVKTVYAPWSVATYTYMGVVAALTFVAFLLLFPYSMKGLIAWFVVPMLVLVVLYRTMKKNIQGYTGDCCGAAVLLCELSMHITMAILAYQHVNL